MDGGFACREGDVPENVQQRVDGPRGWACGVHGETEAEVAAGGGERGSNTGQRADHEG